MATVETDDLTALVKWILDLAAKIQVFNEIYLQA